jgi:Mg2+/Co2+ transporter CorC
LPDNIMIPTKPIIQANRHHQIHISTHTYIGSHTCIYGHMHAHKHTNILHTHNILPHIHAHKSIFTLNDLLREWKSMAKMKQCSIWPGLLMIFIIIKTVQLNKTATLTVE